MEKNKILLIDDESDFVDFMKMRLEHDGGYEVKALSDSKDVIRHVHEFVPDVILLDLLMPGLGGMEICEILDNDPVGIGIHIIILSGIDNEADKVSAYKCGVVGYFVKPIDVAALLKSIEKAIKGKNVAYDK